MSEENVEVVKRWNAAFNAGDMDAVREILDPDVVIGRELEGWPETGPFAGREASYVSGNEAWMPFLAARRLNWLASPMSATASLRERSRMAKARGLN
jgi:ketosteroid isomerase-like protein